MIITFIINVMYARGYSVYSVYEVYIVYISKTLEHPYIYGIPYRRSPIAELYGVH